jgi:hypothetical protein
VTKGVAGENQAQKVKNLCHENVLKMTMQSDKKNTWDFERLRWLRMGMKITL